MRAIQASCVLSSVYLAASLSLVQLKNTVEKSVASKDDLCSIENAINLLRQSQNNLGGLGPSFGDKQEMFFDDVFPLCGTKMNLRVTNTTEYTPKNVAQNGPFFSFNQINIAAGSSVELLFEFLEEQNGGLVPVVVPAFVMTFFDFDSGKLGLAKESVYVYGATDSSVSTDTELKLLEKSDSVIAYEATEIGTIKDNPKHPLTLTDEMKMRSAAFTFESVSSFKLKFAATPPRPNKPAGRNFLFSGPSGLTCPAAASCVEFVCPAGLTAIPDAEYYIGSDSDTCCTAKQSCSEHTCSAGLVLKMNATALSCESYACIGSDDASCCEDESALCSRELDLSNVTENNLDGKGPEDDAQGKTITFSNVFPQSSLTVDLVVSALSPYVPRNTKKNGAQGSFGNVNVLSGESVNLMYQFVDQATRQPATVPGFFWTFYDLDTGKKGFATETVQVSGWTEYFLSERSELEAEKTNDAVIFYGTEMGKESDNPVDLLALTQGQRDRTVTFRFPPTSSFEVKMGASDFRPGKPGGRNIYFAGASALQCGTKI